MSQKLLWAASVAVILCASPAYAASDADIKALQAEIQAMKQNYETKIGSLENRLKEMETAQADQAAKVASVEPAAGGAVSTSSSPQASANAFNPAIGAVLNGHYGAFSEKNGDIKGFGVGEEGGRSGEGLALDEAELNFSANVDDKFTGKLTASLSEEDGETEVELEEAFVQTTALPAGLAVKAGRFLQPIGYINEHHEHTDDFADRPLPNRVFLNNAYKDDGVMASWILPTDLYTELGAGIYRGSDFPGGGSSGADSGAWLGYARTGGDIGDDISWLAGLSTLQTDPDSRLSNDDVVDFHGKSNLYAASLRLAWAPTGNTAEQEVSLQGEYFRRYEDGTYEDTDAGTGAVNYDDHQNGWYVQSVYKFAPQWRIGARYSELDPGSTPVGLKGSILDSEGHNPWNAALMGDWSNSEFSRLRLQYGHEEAANNQKDDQIILQYIMSIGAHPAHIF
ncbi:MAG: hypothetical protein LRY36_01000 [Alphaproteobacteria bacterium]|nr:hypothetical protein [Alphaproteobacteria bacterium]